MTVKGDVVYVDVVWVFLTVMDAIQHVLEHGKHRPIQFASVIQ